MILVLLMLFLPNTLQQDVYIEEELLYFGSVTLLSNLYNARQNWSAYQKGVESVINNTRLVDDSGNAFFFPAIKIVCPDP